MVKNPSAMQEAPYSAEDVGSIPGSGRSPGEGNGNPLQYSCLENPRDSGAWWAAVMLSKAHLTSHSRMFGSRLVITPLFYQNSPP